MQQTTGGQGGRAQTAAQTVGAKGVAAVNEGEYTLIMPQNCRISPRAVIGKGAVVGPFCTVEEGASVGENARIGPFCTLGGGADIGEGAEIGPHCRVQNCTVGKSARIGGGCTLAGGAVGEGAELGPGCEVQNSKISTNAEVGQGCILRGAAVGERARLGARCRIEESAVGAGARVDESVLRGARVGEDAQVGPFAHLRPGADIGARCRVGSFVEVKAATLGEGVRAGHLAYLGDCTVGRGTNVGCGVVFCNFDGAQKRRAAVGEGCFLGSNVNVVAPASLGAGCYVAAGTTVTGALPAHTFAVGRAKTSVRPDAKGRYRPALGKEGALPPAVSCAPPPSFASACGNGAEGNIFRPAAQKERTPSGGESERRRDAGCGRGGHAAAAAAAPSSKNDKSGGCAEADGGKCCECCKCDHRNGCGGGCGHRNSKNDGGCKCAGGAPPRRREGECRGCGAPSSKQNAQDLDGGAGGAHG